MSLSFSDRAPQPKSYVGIGLVVALHLAGIYALSAGLIKAPPRQHEATILLPPIPEKPREPEILREPKFQPDKPSFQPIQVPEIQPQPWQLEQTPTVTTTTQREEVPTTASGTTTTVAQAHTSTTEQPQVRSAGAVCSVMPRPDVPSVNWTGEAVLQVIATVRGGRVVGTDFRVAQGALDGKTRRSLQRSVESALAGYHCQGDAMFQQDFAFRID
ncbi:MAG TPA: hypothetical protein VIN03_09220 [Roseateles sp.]